MSSRALSYAHGATDIPLRGETIGDMWDRVVARHPDREALVSCHQGIRWTYRQLDEQVGRCARGLIGCGVAKGDRVGIWSPNNAEWVVSQLAAAKIGAILVNINPSYRRTELEFVLNQSGARLLIFAPGFKGANYQEILDRVSAPALRQAVMLGRGWQGLLDRSDSVPPEALREREADLDLDEPINIQYTSGTTGAPKGATLSHHNILNNGFFVGEMLGYTEADRVCLPVPFHHSFGMVLGNLAAFSHASTVVAASEAFDPRATLRAVSAERCTSLYGVPTMFIAELTLPDFAEFDLSSLRTGVMGGSPCPVEVMRRVQDEMHIREMTICYGMTETSPISTQTGRGAPLEKRVETVGKAHPHVELKVVDPATGRTVRRGETGELLTRGYSIMLGYWEDERATREAIDAAGWMHTGDLAVMDEDGYVRIVGRGKDTIIRGGENISPREVEEFLHTHPDITDAQVFGVPDDFYGEVVCAWVIARTGSRLDEDDVRAYCEVNIARFKIPRYVRFVEEFPLTATGKVQKFRMRQIELEKRRLRQAARVEIA